MLRYTFIIIFLFYLTGLKSQNISASVELEKKEVLIGDQLRGQIIVSGPQGTNFGIPVLSDYWNLKNMEIFNISNPVKENTDKSQQFTKISISLIFWDTGTYVLPALPFSYIKGSQPHSFFTESNVIKVHYPKGITGDSSYLAPIKPILDEARTFWDFLMDFQPVILGIFAIIVIAVLGYFAYKMRKDAQARKAKLSPEAKALNSLNELLESDLVSNGKLAEYHERISLILREYLSVRFEIRALESVSSEIMEQINNKNITDLLKKDLKEVLETADLVKFAKASALPAANTFAADYIRKLIDFVLEKQREEAESKNDKKTEFEN